MTILEMSGSAAVLIAAILLLRRAALYRLPKWTFLVLWGVALFRLLVPISVSSQFSIYTGAELVKQLVQTKEQAGDPAPVLPFETVTEQARPSFSAPSSGTAPNTSTYYIAPSVEETFRPTAEPVSPVLTAYRLGVILCGLFFGLAYWRCRREFRTAIPVTRDFITRWQAMHPMRPPVQIKQSGRIKAPLTYGLLRPVILLPEGTDWKDEEQLGYVLTHEYIHIRRRDVWWKLLLIFALCLHWFNPFVWAMYFFANRDIELSCDEAVVRAFGTPARSAYALSLIKSEEEKKRFTPLCSNYNKSAIEERITAIMKIKKRSLPALTAAVVLVVGITAAFATSAEPNTPDLTQDHAAIQTDPDLKLDAAPAPLLPAPEVEELIPSTVDPITPEPETGLEPDPLPAQAAAEEQGGQNTSAPPSKYPVNSQGHTYGVWTEADGYEDVPDLIYFREDEAAWGYVKREEVYPYSYPVETEAEIEEYLAWYASVRQKQNTLCFASGISIYDQEENDISSRTTVLTLWNCTLTDSELRAELEQGNVIRPSLPMSTAPAEKIPAGRRTYSYVDLNNLSEEDREVIRTQLVNGDYPRNSKGETYGSELLSKYTGYRPDLILVQATNGETGYTLLSDNNGHFGYTGDTETLEGVGKYMEWLKTQPCTKYIPVYDAEHDNVIGVFELYNSEGYDRSQEDIDDELETVAWSLKNTLGLSDEEIEDYIWQMREEYDR